jgi:hypothetical protein
MLVKKNGHFIMAHPHIYIYSKVRIYRRSSKKEEKIKQTFDDDDEEDYEEIRNEKSNEMNEWMKSIVSYIGYIEERIKNIKLCHLNDVMINCKNERKKKKYISSDHNPIF